MIRKNNNGQFEHIWTFTDADGAALDISGSQFASLIRKRGATTSETVNFTLTKTGTAGELKAVVAAADVAGFSGQYDADILEKDGSGKIYFFHRETLVFADGILAVAGATWQ